MDSFEDIVGSINSSKCVNVEIDMREVCHESPPHRSILAEVLSNSEASNNISVAVDLLFDNFPVNVNWPTVSNCKTL
jgi:hypothetical protein